MAQAQGDHNRADSNASAKVREERRQAASRDTQAHAKTKRSI